MIKIIVFSLLMLPVFAGAQEKSPAAQAESANKTVYQTLIDELLKDCTGCNKAIAVAGFSYSDGRDSRDGGVVAERITTELVKAKKFKVIERKEIEKVFEELKLQRSGAINPDSAKEIGKMLGADWVVVGTLTELPDTQLELNVRLVGVESGEIINAANIPILKNWLDQYKKLLEEQNKAIEKNAKDAKAFYERGSINNDLKEYDRAIANFGIAITINPVYWEAYRGRAVAYVYGSSDWDKAIEDVNRAIEINPQGKSSSGASSYRVRGILYFQKEEYSKATEDLTKAIEIDPKDVYAYYWRGRAYIKKQEYDKAINDFNKGIEIDPKNADRYYWRGIAYSMDGIVHEDKNNYDKVIRDYTKAIEINPQYVEVYISRGYKYMGKENEKALSDFNKAKKLDPSLLTDVPGGVPTSIQEIERRLQ